MKASSRVMRRARSWLLVPAALAAAALPASAQAMTFTFSGGVLTATGGSGEDNLAVNDEQYCPSWGLSSPCISVQDFGTPTVPPECSTPLGGFFVCQVPNRVVVNLEGGGDIFTTDRLSVAVEVHGGSGDDILKGGRLADRLYGEGGADFIAGYLGDDVVDGGAGDDGLDWEGVDAQSDANLGTDTLVGGAGVDTVYYASRGESVIASIDGVANDGAIGERDNISLDVEAIKAGDGDDTLTGSEGPNRLEGGPGSDTIVGLGGADAIDGGDDDDTIDGGAGDDTLSGGRGDDGLEGDTGDDHMEGGDGDDTLSGGAGNDTLYGMNNDDTLIGEAGNDITWGGSGNDRIETRDNEVDFVNCGPGSQDVAIVDVDTIDVIDEDFLADRCETVDEPPDSTPTVTPTAATTTTPVPVPTVLPAPASPLPYKLVLSDLRAPMLRLGKPGTLRFNLSATAIITLKFARKAGNRYAAVAGSLIVRGKAGANTLRFDGRVSRRALKTGSYRVTATARDTAGRVSAPITATLKVHK